MDERQDSEQTHIDELAEAFDTVWNEFRSVMGSTSTVALMRRAADMCSESCPRLQNISFKSEGNKIKYELPPESAECELSINELISFTNTLLGLAKTIAGDVFVGYLLKNPVIRKYTGEDYDEDQQD